MYAVIESGGKQYRVELGSEIQVDRLDVTPGQTITLQRVLLVADGDISTIGRPVVEGATVSAAVVGQDRGEKIVVFKYKPKARRRVKKGHRADLTTLRISDIEFGGRSAAAEAEQAAQERARHEEAAAREAAKAAAAKAAADQALAAQLAATEARTAEAEAPQVAETPETPEGAEEAGTAEAEAPQVAETPETPEGAEEAGTDPDAAADVSEAPAAGDGSDTTTQDTETGTKDR
jgi:large subunit ribosomal protein L21